jgi:hypothetical protein
MTLAFLTITMGVGGCRSIFTNCPLPLRTIPRKYIITVEDNNLSKEKRLQKTFSNLALHPYSLNIHTKLKFLSFSISISLIFLTSKIQIIPRNASPVNVLCRVSCSVTL